MTALPHRESVTRVSFVFLSCAVSLSLLTLRQHNQFVYDDDDDVDVYDKN